MALILAIEPDRRQAAQLTDLVRTRVRADLVLAETTEGALGAIGSRVPDLVLVPTLLSPQDDAALAGALRVIATAARVNMLTIPLFADDRPAPPKPAGLFARFRKQPLPAPTGCDPSVFADQIKSYLLAARAEDDDGFEDAPAAAPPAAPALPPPPSPTPVVTRAPRHVAAPAARILFTEPVVVREPAAVTEPVVVHEPVVINEPVVVPEPVRPASFATEPVLIEPVGVAPVRTAVPAVAPAEVAPVAAFEAAAIEAVPLGPVVAPPIVEEPAPAAAVVEEEEDPLVLAILNYVPAEPLAPPPSPIRTAPSAPLAPAAPAAPAATAAPAAPGEAPDAPVFSQSELDELYFAETGTPPPAPPAPKRKAGKPARPEWSELVASLRVDVERIKAEGTEPAKRAKSGVRPAAGSAARRTPKPIQDQWGLFDPQQCGFAALLAKLEEITEVPADGTSARVLT